MQITICFFRPSRVCCCTLNDYITMTAVVYAFCANPLLGFTLYTNVSSCVRFRLSADVFDDDDRGFGGPRMHCLCIQGDCLIVAHLARKCFRSAFNFETTNHTHHRNISNIFCRDNVLLNGTYIDFKCL